MLLDREQRDSAEFDYGNQALGSRCHCCCTSEGKAMTTGRRFSRSRELGGLALQIEETSVPLLHIIMSIFMSIHRDACFIVLIAGLLLSAIEMLLKIVHARLS